MPYTKYVKIEGGSKLGSFITPMTATLSDEPAFDSPQWVFEIKWDGYRAVAELNGKDTRLYSRNGLLYNKAYPKIFEALTAIKSKAVIDGEVVVYDTQGKPSFQSLQNYNSRQKLPIQFQAFDILQYKGKDLTKLPLVERKDILRDLLPESETIKYCEHIEAEGTVLFEHAVKMGLEGIIAKKANSLYTPGKRTKDWLKIKNVNTDDFKIIGFTDPQNSRQYFGALLIGQERKGKLMFAGEVGTGYTNKLLKELYELLKPLEVNDCPLDVPVRKEKGYHWVKPIYSCQVQYTEFTNEGSVRHPSFQGLRHDK